MLLRFQLRLPIVRFALLWAVAGATASAVAPQAGETASPDADVVRERFATEFLIKGEAETAFWTLTERMKHHRVPAMSVAVVRNGELAWAAAAGVKQVGSDDLIDAETVFSVASVSKVATAAATLRLVDRGTLDLDNDVNAYMSNWQVPDCEFTAANPVTLRRIMSHTAGLTVHGFKDFQPHEPLPTTRDILNGRRPAKNKPVRVAFAPGTKFKYSGGGVTIEQLIIEEALDTDFSTATQRLVFEPLQMMRTTFTNPLPAAHGNIAKAHNGWGKPCALPRGWESMPEMAASGLWTTPSDYAKLVIALIDSHRGINPQPFLSQALAQEMMTEVKPGSFGLGPALHGSGTDRRFQHSGSNESYKAFFEGNLTTGDGVVICTNGANGKRLIQEARVAIARLEGWPDSSTERPSGLRQMATELLRQMAP